MAEVCDMPAAVVYAVRRDGDYVYSYPREAGVHLLGLTDAIPVQLSTPERIAKYTARGYKFK